MGYHDAPPSTTWSTEPLKEPREGFELCYDCDGSKACLWCGGDGNVGDKRCQCCNGGGWCSVCGGLGEWPLDPNTPYTAPRMPLINLKHVAEQRKKPSR